MSASLISVIGPPAVGKTTLAELLAAELPATLIREDYEGNPFLADSYTGPREARLPAQLFYLLSRVSQLSAADWPDDGVFVSDYGFCQDRLYATHRLSADEMRVYDPVHDRLAELIHPPDVLIGLDASVGTLLERIARRGRDFERAITADFLSSMKQAYNGVIDSAACPVVTVQCNEVNLLASEPRKGIVAEVRRLL